MDDALGDNDDGAEAPRPPLPAADCRFAASSARTAASPQLPWRRGRPPPVARRRGYKMPSDGPFLDLETMGEGGGDGASWWKGRGWSEMRAIMSNLVERLEE